MCCGIVKSDLMLRLGTEAAMKSMIYVEAAGIDADSSLERWVRLAELARVPCGTTLGSHSGPARKTRGVDAARLLANSLLLT
jgi:hypothetical protein